jgi:hypothetical protein
LPEPVGGIQYKSPNGGIVPRRLGKKCFMERTSAGNTCVDTFLAWRFNRKFSLKIFFSGRCFPGHKIIFIEGV